MKHILNIQGLAAALKISRQSVHALLRESRIDPDLVDNAGKKYWLPASAQRLAELHEQQRGLPSRTLRNYKPAKQPAAPAIPPPPLIDTM